MPMTPENTMLYCAAPKNVEGMAAVTVILPLSTVSKFDPRTPPPNAYGCDESVQLGWVMTDKTQTLAWTPPGEKTPIQVTVPIFQAPPPPPAPTAAQLLIAGEQAVQATLDALARTKGYDSMASLCSYVGNNANLKGSALMFQQEGNAGSIYRSLVWANLYAAEARISATKTITEAQQAALATMPIFSWPDGSTVSPQAPTVLIVLHPNP